MHLVYVDSLDSFAHNLVQAFEADGARVTVVQSSTTSVSAVRALRPERLVLGPGPGHPEDAGALVEIAATLAGEYPMLGVCLGHQAIGLAFGARVRRHAVVHGHAPPVHHRGVGLFRDLPPAVPMTRYHSLVVDRPLPAVLVEDAWSDDGAVMAMSHRELPVASVQFHPESVLSGAAGMALLRRFTREGLPSAAPVRVARAG